MAVLVNMRNCLEQLLGTGITECMANIDSEPIGFFLADKQWTLPKIGPTDFDQAYITDRIQDGTFVPFLNKLNFTDNSEESVFETFDSGIKGPVRSGFPEYLFTFNNGLYFQKAAYSYNSFQTYNVIIAFANNALLMAETVDTTEVTAFQGGYVDTATYMLKTGSSVTKTPVAFQLINAEQFNARALPLLSQESGIDLSLVNGRLDVILTLQEPTALDTDLIFSATNASNETINVEGFGPTDFRVVGTTGAILTVVYDTNTNLYTMGLDAAVASTENIFVQLYDAAFTPDPVPAVNLAGQIYGGTSNTVIVP